MAVPFFIGQIPVWHSMHFMPLSAWIFPSTETLPDDAGASHSMAFPGPTAEHGMMPNESSAAMVQQKRAHSFIPILLYALLSITAAA
jgi:hypothetical protein